MVRRGQGFKLLGLTEFSQAADGLDPDVRKASMFASEIAADLDQFGSGTRK